MMLDLTSLDPFAFLTPSRIQAFGVAIKSANAYHQASIAEKGHVYDHVSNRGKSFISREWGIAHIIECLSDDEGAIPRHNWNMSGIQFDQQYFVRLVKIEDPESPPPEPKTILRARKKAEMRQLELGFPDYSISDDERKKLLLHELYLVTAGYIKSATGLITELYFIDQQSDPAKVRQLDYTSMATSRVERGETELPKTIFTLKSTLNEKEEVQWIEK